MAEDMEFFVMADVRLCFVYCGDEHCTCEAIKWKASIENPFLHQNNTNIELGKKDDQ